jgi:hypothetical protein
LLSSHFFVRIYERDLEPESRHQNGIDMSGMDSIGAKELVSRKEISFMGFATPDT